MLLMFVGETSRYKARACIIG